jgi:AbrB family looped-hinge helix DNA binding protein
MNQAGNQEGKIMALVRLLRGGQVTLPAEMRQKLDIKEGDYLEAEVVEAGMLLKPVSVVDRKAAWAAIREAQQSVRYIGPEPRPSPEEEEEMIFEAVEAFRHRQHD